MNKYISEKKKLPGWIKKTIPIAVSILILLYYFIDQNWGNLFDSARRANLILAISAVLFPQLNFWFFEVLIVERHFSWFFKPFPWKTYAWTRGAMYLLLLINSTLGGGGILFYLHRKSGISWTKLLGITLFRFCLSIWAIGFMLVPVSVIMHYNGSIGKLNINIYILWGLLLVNALSFTEFWFAWRYEKYFSFSRIFSSRRNREFWTAFREATGSQWALTLLMGVAPVFINLAGFWLLAIAFRIHIPFPEYIIVAPLIYIISELPIAFGGFGTTTMAWFLFLGDYGNKDALAALTLFLPFARVSVRLLIGSISLPIALKDIGQLIKKENGEDL